MGQKLGQERCHRCGNPCSRPRKLGLQPTCARCQCEIRAEGRVARLEARQDELATIQIEFPDKKRGRIDPRAWLAHAQSGQRLRVDASNEQNAATVVIKTRQPIAICFTADWHLGSCSVDYAAMLAHHDYILKTPRVFAITVGDLIDNFVSFKSALPILSQVIDPETQGKVLGALMKEWIDANKLLAVCAGNHDDERDRKLFGRSPMAQFFGEHRPYFPGIGHMRLRVGDIEYSQLLDHKSRFNSSLNPIHSNQQLYRLNEAADVVVTAHTHSPALEWLYRYGRKTIWAKCGSFQGADDFSQRYYEPGIIGTPTIVFHPNRKEFHGFETAQAAVAYMRGLTNGK